MYILLSTFDTLSRTNYCYFCTRYIYCIIEASLLHNNSLTTILVFACMVSILSRSSWSGHFELKNVQITNITDNNYTFVNVANYMSHMLYISEMIISQFTSDIYRAVFMPVYMQCRLYRKGIYSFWRACACMPKSILSIDN